MPAREALYQRASLFICRLTSRFNIPSRAAAARSPRSAAVLLPVHSTRHQYASSPLFSKRLSSRRWMARPRGRMSAFIRRTRALKEAHCYRVGGALAFLWLWQPFRDFTQDKGDLTVAAQAVAARRPERGLDEYSSTWQCPLASRLPHLDIHRLMSHCSPGRLAQVPLPLHETLQAGVSLWTLARPLVAGNVSPAGPLTHLATCLALDYICLHASNACTHLGAY